MLDRDLQRRSMNGVWLRTNMQIEKVRYCLAAAVGRSYEVEEK